MPYLEIATNISRDKINTELLIELSKCLTKSIGKPENYCEVRVIPDQLMTFGGTTETCAIARLMSIGNLGVKENKKHSAAISEFVEKNLQIPRSRMYITFEDRPASEVGYDGTTFHEILGLKK
ncbi:UNVERIFIED_CONTAM: hypothetical protein RMT77_002754 [Armadillidium vulgare]|nr:hypothetical protein Avbf_16986 [Armadillidium vulgare]